MQFYVADSQPNAAYIKDWDTWRDRRVLGWMHATHANEGLL